MTPEQAQGLMRSLGELEYQHTGEGWQVCRCPLRHWLHKGGTDHSPSCAVNAERNAFNCFTCEGGDLKQLVNLVMFHAGRTPGFQHGYNIKQALEILDGATPIVTPLPPYEGDPDEQFRPLPESALERFAPVMGVPRALDYLRGLIDPSRMPVSKAAVLALDLRYDLKRDMLVTPYRTWGGALAGFRGRAIDPTTPKAFRHHDYRKEFGVNNAGWCFLNEVAFTRSAPVIVCEGQFDVANVLPVYPHVVGNLTAKITSHKMKTLLSATDGVLFMLDNDEPGAIARDKAVAACEDAGIPYGVIDYDPQWKDPGKIPRTEIYALLKDTLPCVEPQVV